MISNWIKLWKLKRKVKKVYKPKEDSEKAVAYLLALFDVPEERGKLLMELAGLAEKFDDYLDKEKKSFEKLEDMHKELEENMGEEWKRYSQILSEIEEKVGEGRYKLFNNMIERAWECELTTLELQKSLQAYKAPQEGDLKKLLKEILGRTAYITAAVAALEDPQAMKFAWFYGAVLQAIHDLKSYKEDSEKGQANYIIALECNEKDVLEACKELANELLKATPKEYTYFSKYIAEKLIKEAEKYVKGKRERSREELEQNVGWMLTQSLSHPL
ncbi:hypothetical protein DRJ19_06005 [Candidatus Woesearchaeota archaeon]|nr:MAG: hypothetical protein DRJ19_06005 [Candidatus Woesearchaeota archaeon]